MPNYRAVSAGEIPPPHTAKEAFKIATQNSFDYSSFLFVGITSLLVEGTNAHPALGKGVTGYGSYYWRGFVDKTDGNYLGSAALTRLPAFSSPRTITVTTRSTLPRSLAVAWPWNLGVLLSDQRPEHRCTSGQVWIRAVRANSGEGEI
jgi:hypothetical protein